VRVHEAGAGECVYAGAFKKVSWAGVHLMCGEVLENLPTCSQIAAFLRNPLELCRKAGHFAIYSMKSAFTLDFSG
jgi:hypothetical protein